MSTDDDPILAALRKLAGKVDAAPVMLWGTVTQASPLMVTLDGAIDPSGAPVAVPAQSAVGVLSVGQRVWCTRQSRRVIVTNGTPLPDLLTNYGSSASDPITAAAATWQTVVASTAVTFGPLTRPLRVRAVFRGQATTVQDGSYAMIGVGITGGLSLSPEIEQGTGLQRFADTPFSNSGGVTSLYGSKRVVIPAGPATSFQLWCRRNTTSTTAAVSYTRLEVIPERWM